MAAKKVDPQEMFLQHGEKMIGGLAALLAIGIIVYVVFMAGEKKAIDLARGAGGALTSQSPIYAAERDETEARWESFNPQRQWQELASAGPLPEWSGERQPVIVRRVGDRPIARLPVQTHQVAGTARLREIATDIGQVLLTYEVGQGILPPERDDVQEGFHHVYEHDPTKEVVIERQQVSGEDASEAWTEVGRGPVEAPPEAPEEGEPGQTPPPPQPPQPGTETPPEQEEPRYPTFLDTTVRHKTVYRYRVLCFSEHDQRGLESEPMEVTTRGIFEVHITATSQDSVTFRIDRRDAPDATPVTMRIDHKVGDVLGCTVKQCDIPGHVHDFEHRDYQPRPRGQAPPVEFNPGWVVREFQPGFPVTVEWLDCPSQNPELCRGPEYQSLQKTFDRIVIAADAETVQELLARADDPWLPVEGDPAGAAKLMGARDTDLHPERLDHLCSAHGAQAREEILNALRNR